MHKLRAANKMFPSIYKHCGPTARVLTLEGQEAALWLGIMALQVDHTCPFGVFPPTLAMQETTSSCLNPCSAAHPLG